MSSLIFFFLVPRKQDRKEVPNPSFINYAPGDLNMDSFISCHIGFFICDKGIL